jgi:hypothetical protein
MLSVKELERVLKIARRENRAVVVTCCNACDVWEDTLQPDAIDPDEFRALAFAAENPNDVYNPETVVTKFRYL